MHNEMKNIYDVSHNLWIDSFDIFLANGLSRTSSLNTPGYFIFFYVTFSDEPQLCTMLETVTKRRPVMEISRYKNAALTMMLDYEIHQSIIIYLKRRTSALD